MPKNDWTLDVNALISAKNGKSEGEKAVRTLLLCIADHGYLCWSAAAASAYSARGVAVFRVANPPPPVPVNNVDNANWVENWLRRPEVPGRIIAPRLQKLTGSEEDDLRRAQFRDQDDFPFLVLARSSDSKRLVTREEDFNRQAQRGIHRILGVVCKGYEEARDECGQG
jgi:predicted nucleic acid-binding protein